MIASIKIRLAMWKLHRAQAKLQIMTDERRESFETEQYRRRRKAALKHTRGELA